jgi:hypothetical protein
MLGRLQMSVDECIQQYQSFMSKVFNKTKLGKYTSFAWNGEFYDAKLLESIIKDLIREKLGKDDVPLLDENDPCKMYWTVPLSSSLTAHSSQIRHGRPPGRSQ